MTAPPPVPPDLAMELLDSAADTVIAAHNGLQARVNLARAAGASEQWIHARIRLRWRKAARDSTCDPTVAAIVHELTTTPTTTGAR